MLGALITPVSEKETMVGGTPTPATRFIDVWYNGIMSDSESEEGGSIPSTSAN